MRALLSPLLRLADSITGRTFLILSVGVTTAAVLSLGLVVHTRALEFEAMRQSEVVARAQQIQTRWEAVSRGEQPRASLDTIIGIRILDRSPAYEPDPETERHLNTVLGSASAPRAGKVPVEACLPGNRRQATGHRAQPQFRNAGRMLADQLRGDRRSTGERRHVRSPLRLAGRAGGQPALFARPAARQRPDVPAGGASGHPAATQTL